MQTYWALSNYEEADPAIGNLQECERAQKKHIHCLLSSGEVYVGDHEPRSVPGAIREKVKAWLTRRAELSAAVWTWLPTNWEEKRRKPFSIEDAGLYANELEELAKLGTADQRRKAEAVLRSAREDVRNTPTQVQTAVRRRLSHRLEWADVALSPVLFAGS